MVRHMVSSTVTDQQNMLIQDALIMLRETLRKARITGVITPIAEAMCSVVDTFNRQHWSGSNRYDERIKSAGYKAWEQEAGYTLIGQPRHRHEGPVEVVYSYCPPDKRHRDVFNYEKCVSDLLVAYGLLADDSLIQRGTCEWKHQPYGVIVTDLAA
jgi:Holliday junction resolvase RusA-like endonuclease